jgi:hypothetical protein
MIISVMLARQITLPRPFPTKLTPLFRYSCRLFVALKKVNPFGIKQIRTLFAKYRGWGIPKATTGHPGWGVSPTACLGALRPAPPRSITPFRFNTCKSVTKQTTLTPFRMNTYGKPRGRGATSGLICSFSGSGMNAQQPQRIGIECGDICDGLRSSPHPGVFCQIVEEEQHHD